MIEWMDPSGQGNGMILGIRWGKAVANAQLAKLGSQTTGPKCSHYTGFPIKNEFLFSVNWVFAIVWSFAHQPNFQINC